MGEVVRMHPPRDLAHIIAEILLDEARFKDVVAKHFNGGLSEADNKAWDILEHRLSANKAEAKAIITNLTGIDWEELEAALHA